MSNETKKRDWQGHDIPDDEPEDKKILVWEFTDTDKVFESIQIRDYHEATEWASYHIQELMDNAGEEELKEKGLTITAKLVETTVGEYRTRQEQAEDDH